MRTQYSLTDALMQSQYQLDPCSVNHPVTLTEDAFPQYVVTPQSLHSDIDEDFLIGGLCAVGWKFVDAAVNITQENGGWCLSSAMPAQFAKHDIVLDKPSRRRVKKETGVTKPQRAIRPRMVTRRSAADQVRAEEAAKARDLHLNAGHVASDPSRFTSPGVVMSGAQLIGMGPDVTVKTRDAIRTLLTYPVDDMIEMLRENVLPEVAQIPRASSSARIIGSGRVM